MKKIFPILFLFLLFVNSYSMRPKDVYELPKVPNNRTHVQNKNHYQRNKGDHMKYFSFNLKDLFRPSDAKKDYFYFELNSSFVDKKISYAFMRESKEKINIGNIAFDKSLIWYSPNITSRNYYTKRIIYQFAIYLNGKDKSKQSIIIRAGPSLKNENVTCQPLKHFPQALKDKFNTVSRTQINNPRNHHDHDKRHNHGINKKPDYEWKYKGHKAMDKPYKNNTYNGYKWRYKHRYNGGMVILSVWLFIIWSFVAVLYCLVNRRKKPFLVAVKNPQEIGLSHYQNI